MKKLTEADVIRMMNEEWDKKVFALVEKLDVAMSVKVDGEDKQVLSPDLKVKHKASGILYTIVSVSPQDVILKTPEGEQFIVDADELEHDYLLD